MERDLFKKRSQLNVYKIRHGYILQLLSFNFREELHDFQYLFRAVTTRGCKLQILQEVLKGKSISRKFQTEGLFSSFSMRWGGVAGDGLQSTGLLFGKYLNSIGYYFHGIPGNQSTIRGGHIWYQIDFSEKKQNCADNQLDLLIALNQEAIEVHINELKAGGILLYNLTPRLKIEKFSKKIEELDLRLLGVPFTEIAREINLKTPILANTVSIGTLLSILQLELIGYKKVIEQKFRGKDKIIANNSVALEKGKKFIDDNFDLKLNLVAPQLKPKENIVVTGNHAIAIGAVAAGLKFLAQYPITPASSILSYLSQNAQKFGVVVRQVEDEIAAIAMAVGASWAGVRSMTATSGPGISLMAENIGLAGITETPVVIINAQRGGPSTGVPTKTEQSDLLTVINLSHGEFPRAVFAPRNIEEAYTITVKAFNVAEKYQIPVFILSDFALSERLENIKAFDLKVKIERGKVLDPKKRYEEFHRYELTEDGISPRLFAPHPDGIHVAVGAEHDIDSHSLAGTMAGLMKGRWYKERMFEKRFKKQKLLEKEEMDGPQWFGPEGAKISFLCWGATTTAVMETVIYLNELQNKFSFNMLSFSDIFPLPSDKIQPELEKVNLSIIVEANFTGQFERLLSSFLNFRPNGHIRHIDGEILTKTRIMTYLKNIELDLVPGLYDYHRKNEHFNKELY